MKSKKKKKRVLIKINEKKWKEKNRKDNSKSTVGSLLK